MPGLTRITLRISWIHFLVGWTLGAILLIHKSGFYVITTYAETREAHFHIMSFGWMVQLCLGMAFWILPKFVGEGVAFHGAKTLAVASLTALNLGVIASFFASQAAWGFYTCAAALFVFHIWPRVKPFSSVHKTEST